MNAVALATIRNCSIRNCSICYCSICYCSIRYCSIRYCLRLLDAVTPYFVTAIKEPDVPTVAVIGASADRSKYGNKSVRAHQQHGFDVYPVNPKGGTIEGLTAYRSLAEIPLTRLDRISLYVPPHVGLELLDQIAQMPCDELWLNPGSESEELVAAAEELGLQPIVGCSIVAVGASPADL